jgi:hypothetical protein
MFVSVFVGCCFFGYEIRLRVVDLILHWTRIQRTSIVECTQRVFDSRPDSKDPVFNARPKKRDP